MNPVQEVITKIGIKPLSYFSKTSRENMLYHLKKDGSNDALILWLAIMYEKERFDITSNRDLLEIKETLDKASLKKTSKDIVNTLTNLRFQGRQFHVFLRILVV